MKKHNDGNTLSRRLSCLALSLMGATGLGLIAASSDALAAEGVNFGSPQATSFNDAATQGETQVAQRRGVTACCVTGVRG